MGSIAPNAHTFVLGTIPRPSLESTNDAAASDR